MINKTLLRYMGIDLNLATHHEKIISAIGGFIGIFVIIIISNWLVGVEGAVYIIPSMGASAVLVFAVPHSPLAQPWNVIGGHIISASVGVICAQLIPLESVAAALSVGFAIGAMYYARCIHPPGGATALAAVVGGVPIQALGFEFIITPVLVNTVTILLVALLFNYLFKWRRYPSSLALKHQRINSVKDNYASISHGDLVYALSEIDSFIDVTEEDLLKIYQLATGRKVSASMTTEKNKL